MVNPAQIKYFGQSELSRNKDDQPDAALIRRFCEKQQLRPWIPPTPEARELRALSRHRDSLLDTRQQLVNRLDVAPTKAVEKSLRKLVAQLDTEIKRVTKQLEDHIDRHPDLKRRLEQLVSIPGIAKASAAKVLAELGRDHVIPEEALDQARQRKTKRGPEPGALVRRVAA